MVKIFEGENIETEIVHIGEKAIRGCVACQNCRKNGKCIYDDEVNELASKFEECDGLVVGSPVYICISKCNTGGIFNTSLLQYTI